MTTIKIYVEEIKGKKQLMCSFDGNSGYLAALSLGLCFGKKEEISKKLGLFKPEVIVVDNLEMDAPKTKAFVQVLNNLKAEKALVVTNEKNENLVLSARNIPDVKTVPTNAINVYDILKYESLIITKDAVKAIEEVYA